MSTDANNPANARPFFIESIQDFMEVLREDFPGCPDLEDAWDTFETAILDCQTPSLRTQMEEEMIKSFHKNMSGFYPRIYSSDFTMVNDVRHPLFTDLKLKEKFDTYQSADEKTMIFEHLKSLAHFATVHNMHTSIPSGMMAKLTNLGKTMQQQMESTGQMDMPMLLQRTVGIVANGDPGEHAQMQAAMQGGLAGDLTTMLGGMAQQAAQNPQQQQAAHMMQQQMQHVESMLPPQHFAPGSGTAGGYGAGGYGAGGYGAGGYGAGGYGAAGYGAGGYGVPPAHPPVHPAPAHHDSRFSHGTLPHSSGGGTGSQHHQAGL